MPRLRVDQPGRQDRSASAFRGGVRRLDELEEIGNLPVFTAKIIPVFAANNLALQILLLA